MQNATSRDRLRAITIAPDASVRDAMLAIERGACEIALVVDASGRFVGTVSDGDVRRALLHGAALDSAIEPSIATNSIVASPLDPRAEVMDVMRARTISQVPVVDDDGHLVGLHLLRELVGAQHRDNVAVIMAGGRGARLAPLTDSIPKPMVRVAGRPILERLVLHLVGSGVSRIVLAVNYLADHIVDHFGDGAKFGCRIDYVEEHKEQPLGTGGALRLVPTVVGDVHDPVIALNGDLLTQFSLQDLLAHHTERKGVATVAVRDYVHEVPFGVVEDDELGNLRGLLEKPIVSHRVNAGIYVLEPQLLQRIPPDTEYSLPSLLIDALQRGERVALWEFEDEWQDVGQPRDLERASGRG
jgi:dTDP-glucose pyrophosphorylase/CBS domain-containing protein